MPDHETLSGRLNRLTGYVGQFVDLNDAFCLRQESDEQAEVAARNANNDGCSLLIQRRKMNAWRRPRLCQKATYLRRAERTKLVNKTDNRLGKGRYWWDRSVAPRPLKR